MNISLNTYHNLSCTKHNSLKHLKLLQNLPLIITFLNFYPIPEAKYSNLRHRPIGIGVQGFADTLIKLRIPIESPEALKVNEKIFATMYYSALKASVELAKI